MSQKQVPSDSPWNSPEVVARFAASPGNETLLHFANKELSRSRGHRLLDIGCGAGSNAVPLAKMGWNVLGIDYSQAMLDSLTQRIQVENLAYRLRVHYASMTYLPAMNRSMDFIVAHGIWNLARSGAEFRQALAEAARVSKSQAGLFVFTFSRTTLPMNAKPISGESFVFTEFSGLPQCFLTQTQLLEELEAVGFFPEPDIPIKEINLSATSENDKPVIYEGIFRRHPS
jgi:ubiquinone/menaquinone biosynthesis C-methylase UbiE